MPHSPRTTSPTIPRSLRLGAVCAAWGLSGILSLAAGGAAPSPTPHPVSITNPAPANAQGSVNRPGLPGRRQAEITCSICHLVPDPDLLPRSLWQDIVLKKMAFYTGVKQLDPEKNEEADLYKASGLFPSTPMVSTEDWKLIEQYYLDNSPRDRLPHLPRPEITLDLKLFRADPPRFRRNPPLTTAVAIDPAEGVIYVADAQDQALHVLDGQGRLRQTIPVGNIPTWIKKTERGLYLACIGHFFPLEERRGQVILLERTPTGPQRRVLMSSLPRPCHLEFADLNGDGQPEALLSMFGYLTGRFSWIERLDQEDRRENILHAKAGPLVTATHDFDGDGHLDIALLTGQEGEALTLYLGDGHGQFPRTRLVFRHPPTYGHTYFELADFNRDGRPDLLVCNGDNGDYESPPKPYHGLRIYLNQGQGEFTLQRFLPLHGAFRALARDFDEDGDLDIAAVSFYPDYEQNPRESFVYFENTGDLTFRPSTFRECISGRWMVMDAGDVDGDRDLDLVLGSLIRMPSNVPDFVKNAWETNGPSVLILRNTLR